MGASQMMNDLSRCQQQLGKPCLQKMMDSWRVKKKRCSMRVRKKSSAKKLRKRTQRLRNLQPRRRRIRKACNATAHWSGRNVYVVVVELCCNDWGTWRASY